MSKAEREILISRQNVLQTRQMIDSVESFRQATMLVINVSIYV